MAEWVSVICQPTAGGECSAFEDWSLLDYEAVWIRDCSKMYNLEDLKLKHPSKKIKYTIVIFCDGFPQFLQTFLHTNSHSLYEESLIKYFVYLCFV